MKALQLQKTAKFLQQNGYAIIPNFISPKTCKQAIDEIDRLVDAFEPTPQQIATFRGDGKNSHWNNKYFLDSASKVSFFFETKAWKDGKLSVPKRVSINKIGHSLHEHNQIFKKITYTQGVEELCSELGIPNPLVMQSMAILKPPNIGARVSIHQDSTYLYAQPDTLLGFWIPLQDATLNNGCLWGVPGSGKEKLYCRSKIVNGEPKDELYHEKDYKQQDFVPLQMEKGSLAIFNGKFLHKSEGNLSQVSRYAYTWHLMDQSSKWSPENWLQRQYFPKFPLRHIKK